MQEKKIWTVGHSNHSIDHFIRLLHSFTIEVIADVRSYPGSAKFPHFNQENLIISLQEAGISYIHVKDLGGRRKADPDSVNVAWENVSFRGFADYMRTEGFSKGIRLLEEKARNKRTALMCAEAVWWSCHRSLISDFLKTEGWEVMHIREIGKAQEHPYTSPAKVIQGKLFYQ